MNLHANQLCWRFLQRLIGGQFVECESFLAPLEERTRRLLNDELKRVQLEFGCDQPNSNVSVSSNVDEGLPVSLPTVPVKTSAVAAKVPADETLPLTGDVSSQNVKLGSMNILPGTRWGAYRLESAIGKGGMGQGLG